MEEELQMGCYALNVPSDIRRKHECWTLVEVLCDFQFGVQHLSIAFFHCIQLHRLQLHRM